MRLILLIALLCTISGNFAARAEQIKDIEIDGQFYSRGQIVADFLNIAFSETIWNQDTGDDFSVFLSRRLEDRPTNDTEETEKKYKALKTKYPWLADYIYYPEGWPRPHVINKWKNEITIGIGWPKYGEATESTPTSINSIIEDQVNFLIEDISKYTGLRVRFISPEDPQEAANSYAHIRIVPIYHTNLLNYFKTLRWSKALPEEPTINTLYEPQLWGAVPFTPFSHSQVDGYILPNSDNTIGMAVCKIVPEVGEVLIRALVTECLIRSLGLTDISKISVTGVLGEWNKAYNGVSKIPALDGNDKSVWYQIYDETPGFPKKRNFVTGLNESANLLSAFTPYDSYMLKLLYCSHIKSGMSEQEVLQVFSNNCF